VVLSRNEWRRVHRGVYASHTGDLTWLQRAWAAVLFYAPAALCNESALTMNKRKKADLNVVGGSRAIIHVAVAEHRRLEELSGVKLHRLRRFDQLAPEVPTPSATPANSDSPQPSAFETWPARSRDSDIAGCC
jgi:hypothetical protein